MILSYEESLAGDGVSMVSADSAARVEVGVGATPAHDPVYFTMPAFGGDAVDPAARFVPGRHRCLVWLGRWGCGCSSVLRRHSGTLCGTLW